jgi:uncharacterized membrane protein YedE/YeeE
MFVVTKTHVLIQFLMAGLLIGFHMLKIINCVTLSFRDMWIYSRNYVANSHRK